MTKSIFIQAKKKIFSEETTENKENGSSNNAVIIFNKSHFTLDETKSYLDVNNSFETHIENDVYKKLSIFPAKPFNSKSLNNVYLKRKIIAVKVFFVWLKAFKCSLFIQLPMLTLKNIRVRRFSLSKKLIKIGWTYARK